MLFVGGRIMHNIIVYSTPGNWSECAPGVAEIELQILHAARTCCEHFSNSTPACAIRDILTESGVVTLAFIKVIVSPFTCVHVDFHVKCAFLGSTSCISSTRTETQISSNTGDACAGKDTERERKSTKFHFRC